MYGKYGVRVSAWSSCALVLSARGAHVCAFVLRACVAQDKSYDSLIGMATTPEGDPPPSHPMRLSAPGGPTLPA